MEEPTPEEDETARDVIGAAIALNRALGPGYPESVYEEGLAVEFERRGIAFDRQVRVDVVYRGRGLGTGRMDFVVRRHVVVEVKAVAAIAPVHEAQLVSYLKMTGHRVGLLLNFEVPVMTHGIRRRVHTRRPEAPLGVGPPSDNGRGIP